MKNVFTCLLLLFALGLSLPGGGVMAAQPGYMTPQAPQAPLHLAQSFFDRLFGSPQRATPRREPEPRQRPVRRQRHKPAARAAPEVQEQPKNEDAKRVVVIGDAFAYGLAKALERIYAEAPGIEVVNEANGNSGIVRDDYFDWNARVKQLLEEQKIDVAVMMIGSNDRQLMRLPEGRVRIRSTEYEERYIARVDGILQSFAEKRVPVFWVGLPVMRSQSYGEDMAYLNEIYKARASRFGAVFVDIWDRFADEEGRYNASGPDVAGRNRKLRSDNGIYMTRTGYEKIAYFLDKDMQSVLYLDVPAGPSISLEEQGPGLLTLPRGPIEMEVSLTSPQAPEAANELAGARRGAKRPAKADPSDPAPIYKVLVLGESVEPKQGRADDFAWPRPEPESRAEAPRGGSTAGEAGSNKPSVPLPPALGGS